MLIHLDADAFFAAVEQAADARLRGRPVAVGGGSRGVVASASYEARRFGIHGAMPMAKAKKLCSNLVVVPPDFEKYELFSRRLFSYAHDFTPWVEIGSIDEGYLDVSGCRGKSAIEIAQTLRRVVSQSLKISISEGIGRNKLVSQIASKLQKPFGFVSVEEGREVEFLHPLASTWLPGVGPKLGEMLRTGGLTTIGRVAATPPERLRWLVGNLAPQLHAFSQGKDDRPIVPDPPDAKSYGTQETFEKDVTDEAFLLAKLRVMADQLMRKVRAEKKAIRGVMVKVRYNDMVEYQRSESLSEPANLEQAVYSVLRPLLTKAWERRVSVRLLGLRFSQVYDGALVMELPIEGLPVLDERRHRLAQVVDELQRHHFSIMRGHDFWLQKQAHEARPALVAKVEERGKDHGQTHRTLLDRTPEFWVRKASTSVSKVPYVALQMKSVYSLMDSLLTIPAMVEAAVDRGVSALAITDPNLYGAVPFYQEVKKAGLKPVIGAALQCESRAYLAYVENQKGYQNLSQLLSLREGGVVTREELDGFRTGLILLESGGAVASPEVRYVRPEDHLKYQIVQSIRTLTLLREGHPQKRKGKFHFPDFEEMERRYDLKQRREMVELVERCEFEFDFQTLRFPHYASPGAGTPSSRLKELAFAGLYRRYGAQSQRYIAQLEEELSIIGEVGYESYFLTVWELLMECRNRGIQWITRGSAADSLVCYCLEISNVCPIRFELYFRRFLNRDRMKLQKLPDIDVDFAHDRKDEVVELILERYGDTYSAIVGGFSTFQVRSAVAEVAKVLGVADREIRALTKKMAYATPRNLAEALRANHLQVDFPLQEEPYRTVLSTAAFLDGIPRYAKMHPCGVVVSRDPVRHLTPTFLSSKGWPTTHFDMESVEAVGMIKLDILAQGGLAVLRDAVSMVKRLQGVEVDLEQLSPWEDQQIWDRVAAGKNRGVHHIESPAMCTLARMAGIRDIDRLIAIVSVIRPGAANNLKKLEFSRRAQGLEPVPSTHSTLEPILKSTFGVVAYEEHILQICEAFAGMEVGRADLLRRALVKMDEVKIEDLGREFVANALKLGREEKDIRAVWELVSKFQGYAFCRAHSTAYGVEAYQGAYMKCYYPAEFMASVLSHGKGFYSRLAYSLECRYLGIQFRLPCVNASKSMFEVEREDEKVFLRLPLNLVKSLSASFLERHENARKQGEFTSVKDFLLRVKPRPEETLLLIRSGALDGFGMSRPTLFWELRRWSVWEGEALLFQDQEAQDLSSETWEAPNEIARLKEEMELFDFTVSDFPMALYPSITWTTYCPTARLHEFPGQRVKVCGWVVQERLHHQVSGETMKFITLADASGFMECEIFASAYRRWGVATVRWQVLEVEATVQVFENGQGVTLNVHSIREPRKLGVS